MSGLRWPTGEPRTAAIACPACGEQLNAHVPGGGTEAAALPKAGDVSLCAYCASLGIYADTLAGLTLRPATPEEVAEIAEQEGPTLERARREAPLWRQAARQRRAAQS